MPDLSPCGQGAGAVGRVGADGGPWEHRGHVVEHGPVQVPSCERCRRPRPRRAASWEGPDGASSDGASDEAARGKLVAAPDEEEGLCCVFCHEMTGDEYVPLHLTLQSRLPLAERPGVLAWVWSLAGGGRRSQANYGTVPVDSDGDGVHGGDRGGGGGGGTGGPLTLWTHGGGELPLPGAEGTEDALLPATPALVHPASRGACPGAGLAAGFLESCGDLEAAYPWSAPLGHRPLVSDRFEVLPYAPCLRSHRGCSRCWQRWEEERVLAAARTDQGEDTAVTCPFCHEVISIRHAYVEALCAPCQVEVVARGPLRHDVLQAEHAMRHSSDERRRSNEFYLFLGDAYMLCRVVPLALFWAAMFLDFPRWAY